MAARVTDVEVRKIIKVKASEDVSAFINTAHLLIETVCVPPGTYDEVRLKEIELWLSAHFVNINFRRTVRDRVEDAERWFEPGKVDLGLKVTWYGQQVLLLDTDGYLAALNEDNLAAKKVKKNIIWLGSRDRYERRS